MISVGSTPTNVDRVHLISSWQSGQTGDWSCSNERLSRSTIEAISWLFLYMHRPARSNRRLGRVTKTLPREIDAHNCHRQRTAKNRNALLC